MTLQTIFSILIDVKIDYAYNGQQALDKVDLQIQENRLYDFIFIDKFIPVITSFKLSIILKNNID